MKHFVVPIISLMFASHVYAQETNRVAVETRISKQSATETGDRGLFTVPSVETLNKGQFSAGFGWSNIDRSPRDLDIVSLPLFVSVGVHGRLTVTGAFETQKQTQRIAIDFRWFPWKRLRIKFGPAMPLPFTATGFDADKDRLRYTWSASAGQVIGSGEKVTFNTAGLAPGKYTVRATVSDGKGGTATSLIEVTVR